MRKLQKKFYLHGFKYEQLKRDENKALYVQKYRGKVIGFEVIKVLSMSIYEVLKDNLIKEIKTERYPSNEQFGDSAWSYQQFESAQFHYNLI